MLESRSGCRLGWMAISAGSPKGRLRPSVDSIDTRTFE